MAMCYPYCRFSSAGQEGNDSIRRQEELLTQWMQRHPEHTLSPLKLRDLKMSSFRGKNIKSGDLGNFIALVKKENSPIEKNAILVIENLDRFSRLPPRQSLQHFNELINYGITIQTLSPEMEITADNIDNNNMLFPVICTLQRAHEESKIKSARVKSYWANLRKDNKFDQGHLPAWISQDESKRPYIENEALKTIQFIFYKTINGTGLLALVRELNAKFKPFGKCKSWNSCFVHKMLNERTVLGEFQFHKLNDDGSREIVGEPIPKFYPAGIDESTWLMAQASKSSRARRKGRRANDFVNLFTGLIYFDDGFVGHIINIAATRNNGAKHIQHRLQSYGFRLGQSKQNMTVDYFLVEKYILENLRNLSVSLIDINNSWYDERPKKKLALQGIDELEKSLADKLSPAAKNTDSIIQRLNTLQEQKEAIKKEIQELDIKWNSAKDKPIQETRTLIDYLNKNPSVETREKLRSLLSSVISKIILKPYKDTRGKVHTKITIHFVQYIYLMVIDTFADTVQYEKVREHNRAAKKKQIEEIRKHNPEFAEYCISLMSFQDKINSMFAYIESKEPGWVMANVGDWQSKDETIASAAKARLQQFNDECFKDQPEDLETYIRNWFATYKFTPPEPVAKKLPCGIM